MDLDAANVLQVDAAAVKIPELVEGLKLLLALKIRCVMESTLNLTV
jgi:hypothetical protein